MKVRLTNEQLKVLAESLCVQNDLSIECATIRMFGIPEIDDASRQTVETLVSQCPYCGEWTRLEDAETCYCSHSEQDRFSEEEIIFSAENGYHDPCESEEILEE